VNNTAQRTVVLAGESVTARQSLIAKLHNVLLSQSLAFDFLCPQSPAALLDMPALERPYQTLHADNDQVLQQAVFALVNGHQSTLARPQTDSKWQDMCECCADPACEQRLFGRLLQS
jgi:hypothetical protein